MHSLQSVGNQSSELLCTIFLYATLRLGYSFRDAYWRTISVDQNNFFYRLGENIWTLITIIFLALAFWYVGLPLAGYLDKVLFGPKPREDEFIVSVLWLFTMCYAAAGPSMIVLWLSDRVFKKASISGD